LLSISKNLDNILGTLFRPIQQYPNFELVFVMIIVPFVLNIIQFWVQDSFLKGKVNNNRYSHTQVLQHDLDEELISSIEMQDTQTTTKSIGLASPKRFNHYSPVRKMLSKFNINAQKFIFPKRSSSGDLQKMDT
jgi:hypothetical protein